MRGISALLAVMVISLSAAVASAQGADDKKKQAIEHYKNAETAMAAAAYEYAASEYGMAYELMKDPLLFFKIGQADEKAGKCPIAVNYYRRYLKESIPAEAKKDEAKAAEHKRLTEE